MFIISNNLVNAADVWVNPRNGYTASILANGRTELRSGELTAPGR